MRTEALRLLKSLTEAHGAPGHEDQVRQIFHDELKPHTGHTFSTDRLGSVLCRREEDVSGGGPRVMITAHMDEVGFIVQRITKEGFLRFVPLGGWWGHTVLAQAVTVRTNSGRDIVGCVASVPPHQLGANVRTKVMDLDSMCIDVGAMSREQVIDEFGIQLGDSIVPATKFQTLANEDLLMAKAFDNRVGMSVLIQAMQRLQGSRVPNQLLSVATVQEELGCRGSVTAAALAKPDVAIVLEGPPADDAPGMSRDEARGALGEGVQIRIFDPRSMSSKRLVQFVSDLADAESIKHQVTVQRYGGTDASSFQAHEQGMPCIVLGVPSRYIHSHHSIIHIDDYLATLSLVEKISMNLDQNAFDSLVRFL